MNLKFGDVTVRGSPTFSDCHYVKKIIFSLDHCFLSMFSIFVVLFNIVCHLLISCHIFILFIPVPHILFYGELLTLKTHHYKPNSMNSLNSMKELWKNSYVNFQQSRFSQMNNIDNNGNIDNSAICVFPHICSFLLNSNHIVLVNAKLYMTRYRRIIFQARKFWWPIKFQMAQLKDKWQYCHSCIAGSFWKPRL